MKPHGQNGYASGVVGAQPPPPHRAGTGAALELRRRLFLPQMKPHGQNSYASGVVGAQPPPPHRSGTGAALELRRRLLRRPGGNFMRGLVGEDLVDGRVIG